jgi:outer membrane biosynthesis protein TonB
MTLVKIEFNLTRPDEVRAAAKLINGFLGTASHGAEPAKPKSQTATKAKPAPPENETPEPATKPAPKKRQTTKKATPKTTEAAPTIDDLREEFQQAKSRYDDVNDFVAEIKEKLIEYDATSLTTLDPEHYGEVYAYLTKMGA